LVAYGSSLTMAYPPAAHPSRVWTAQVARARGLDHLVLAFPGGAHLDPVFARLIRDRPADYVSLEVGINILRAASLSPRTFGPALVGFVLTVRDGHPDIPIVVQSTIYVPDDDPPGGAAQPNAVGFTLPAMRAEVADVVERLRARGDGRLSTWTGYGSTAPSTGTCPPTACTRTPRDRTRSRGASWPRRWAPTSPEPVRATRRPRRRAPSRCTAPPPAVADHAPSGAVARPGGWAR
jgi:hypothetical protein